MISQRAAKRLLDNVQAIKANGPSALTRSETERLLGAEMALRAVLEEESHLDIWIRSGSESVAAAHQRNGRACDCGACKIAGGAR